MAMTASSVAQGAGSATPAGQAERSPFLRTTELLAPYQPAKPLITLSLGEPQHPVPGFVGPVLAKHIADFGRYPLAKGIEPFRRAAANWLSTRFQLPRPIDPESEILVLNGSRTTSYISQSRSKLTLAPMVNRVLTSPYLWWFDRSGGPVRCSFANPRSLLKVLAFQTWQ